MLTAKHYLVAGLISLAAVPLAHAQQQQDPSIFEGIQGFPHQQPAPQQDFQQPPQQDFQPSQEQFQQPQQQFDQPAQGQFDQPAQETEAPVQQVERLKQPVAEFSGIDKITGRITSFDVYVDETVQFGALQVTPRVCYASPENQEPKTDSFVEVDEITLDRKIRRIFTGWMFAESPGLNAVEHPVYDVWLKACKAKSDVPPPQAADAN